MKILSFQPQEIAKVGLLIWLANFLSSDNRKPLFSFLGSGFLILLVLRQPAVGTAFILSLSTLVVYGLSSVRLRWVLIYALILAAMIGMGILFYRHANLRLKRFCTSEVYHQRHSKIAIGSGGFLGKGLGGGKQKFKFLPKIRTDFIFSNLAEELGFLGTALFLFFYYIFLLRGLSIAYYAPCDFSRLFCGGFIMLIFFYLTIHLLSAFGLIPTTGQPLPFVSYGGTSLVTNLFGSGIMLNISRTQRKEYDF